MTSDRDPAAVVVQRRDGDESMSFALSLSDVAAHSVRMEFEVHSETVQLRLHQNCVATFDRSQLRAMLAGLTEELGDVEGGDAAWIASLEGLTLTVPAAFISTTLPATALAILRKHI